MKKIDGKLVPENEHEAREMVRTYRQAANNKLDWRDRVSDKKVRDNLTNAAKDLLDRAEEIAEEWGIGTP